MKVRSEKGDKQRIWLAADWKREETNNRTKTKSREWNEKMSCVQKRTQTQTTYHNWQLLNRTENRGIGTKRLCESTKHPSRNRQGGMHVEVLEMSSA